MAYRCVGCDREIPWDGEGTFAYTCQCGGTCFYTGADGHMALPSFLVLAIAEKRTANMPHIDYYVGNSNHTSPLKEAFVDELLHRGYTWMKDCPQCLADGTYERHLEREKWLAVREAESIIQGGEK